MKKPALHRGTLIQIHYHNRPGGVTRVMAEYARAFGALADPGRSRSLIVCADYDGGMTDGSGAELHALPVLDYRAFRGVASFEARRTHIRRALERILDGKDLPAPVRVIGHNMALARNPALTAAFADCARSRPGMRFFSVAHDLVEEGRVAILSQIRSMRRLGIDLRRFMYPRLPNLTFVAINDRTGRALAGAGLRVATIVDPVIPSRFRPERGTIRRTAISRSLRTLARRDGTFFDTRRPTAFYPARLIMRKNMPEAVILACLVNGYNLVFGTIGTSAVDRRLYRRLLVFCRIHRLPVVFDCDRLLHHSTRVSAIDLLYGFADCCISTSVLEGFGYSLFEPWTHGKTVYGRIPLGFQRLRGMDTGHLYDRLLVPSRWIDTSVFKEKYGRIVDLLLGEKSASRFIHTHLRSLISNGTVDFGSLDSTNQFRVLQHLVREPAGLDELRAWNGVRRISLSLRSNGSSVIRKNAAVVRKLLGPGVFRTAFARLFLSSDITYARRPVHPTDPRRFYAAPDQLRLPVSGL